MLSLDSTNSPEDLRRFDERVRRGLEGDEVESFAYVGNVLKSSSGFPVIQVLYVPAGNENILINSPVGNLVRMGIHEFNQ